MSARGGRRRETNDKAAAIVKPHCPLNKLTSSLSSGLSSTRVGLRGSMSRPRRHQQSARVRAGERRSEGGRSRRRRRSADGGARRGEGDDRVGAAGAKAHSGEAWLLLLLFCAGV